MVTQEIINRMCVDPFLIYNNWMKLDNTAELNLIRVMENYTIGVLGFGSGKYADKR